MNNKFNDKLSTLLKNDSRFVDKETGELIKSEIIDKALSIDKELIEALISDKEVKDKFFTEIKDHWVFEINGFIGYIQDKNFLSNSYTKFKNKIGLNIDGKFLNERKEVALVWPFKDCILEGGMEREDQKRDEIFFNEILAQDEIDRLLDPKALTNFKRYTVKGEEKVTDFKRDSDGTIKENLIIKGNNLLALHPLKKEFQGKVKLIYIDPPYNTGGDSFTYNDNFNHSTWLTFMKNRLEVAKELLRDDGLIFVQCDDNEQAYLKVLMDEIFTNGFVNCIVPQMSNLSGNKIEHAIKGRRFPKIKEFILIYAKNKKDYKLIIPKIKKEQWDEEYNMIFPNMTKNDYIKINNLIDNDQKEELNQMLNKLELKSLKKYISESRINGSYEWKISNAYRIIASKPNSSLREKAISITFKDQIAAIRNSSGVIKIIRTDFNRDTETARIELVFAEDKLSTFFGDIWFDITTTGGVAQEGGVSLKNGKKPEKLLNIIIESATLEGDIVLDYHLGSGTTCAVAHKMGRQYIGIEQLEYGQNDSVVRLKNVINGDTTGISKSVDWKGGGEFIYFELMKYNEEAIDRIQSAKTAEELLKIWNEMVDHYFLNYDVDVKRFNENQEEFKKLSLDEQKRLLIEMLNKNQLYVNLSEIEDAQFKVSEEDKELNKKFYRL